MHSIKVAAQKSGLTPHVIRIWEKRYSAVTPGRTGTNRRLYSEEEIERLTLLRAVTHQGHSISNIAGLPIEKLRGLAGESLKVPAKETRKRGSAEDAVQAGIDAIRKLDSVDLEVILSRGAVAFGQHGLLQKVISPLAQKIGDSWREGIITAAHEHFASAVIHNWLIRNSRPYTLNGTSPTLVVATPAGQLHELGAVMVAAAANDMGWRVIYLGTSLPALEIAGAAIHNKARAVALSIVFPGDDPDLPHELETLRKHLAENCPIIVGGRAAGSYAGVLKKINATSTTELRELYQLLEGMRVPA
jgi:methylmalonyl-CoA mutase cobalamin-binding domain/chain